MATGDRLPFDPSAVWMKAGLATQYRPSLTHDRRAGWARDRFEAVIIGGQYAWSANLGLAQTLPPGMPEAQTMCTAILVQMVERLWLPGRWPVDRSPALGAGAVAFP